MISWETTLGILADLGHSNRIYRVSELLQPGEVPEREYDMILSFSVFTHLSPEAFTVNIPLLLDGLKPSGRFYFTVRHEEFIAHMFADRSAELHGILDRDGVMFTEAGGNMGTEKIFGEMVVTRPYLEQFVPEGYSLRYLGPPHTLQHVYVIDKQAAVKA